MPDRNTAEAKNVFSRPWEHVFLSENTDLHFSELCLKHPLQCLIAPAGTPWDTQGWSPRTLPALPHFNTSLTNELMDFCRSVWWICAGGSPDFLTDRCPELVRQIAFMKFSPKPKPDLRLLRHLVSGFHMIHPKYALVSQQNHCSCYFRGNRRDFKTFANKYIWWLWPFLKGGNQFPIMNTLSCDGSEQATGLRNCPNFLRYFQSVAQSGPDWGADRSSGAPIKELNWGLTSPGGQD